MIEEKNEFVKSPLDLKPVEFSHHVRFYLRYWLLFVFGVALSALLVSFYQFVSLKQYDVKGSIIINKNINPELKIFGRYNHLEGSNHIENEISLLTSRKLAFETLKKVHFYISYYEFHSFKRIELYNKSPIQVVFSSNFALKQSGIIIFEKVSDKSFILKKWNSGFLDYLWNSSHFDIDDFILNKNYNFNEEISSSHGIFKVIELNKMQIGDQLLFQIHHPINLAERYAKSVSIKLLNNFGSTLQIIHSASLLDKGQDYVNALMESFLENDLKEKNRIADKTIQFLEDQIFVLGDSLKEKENDLVLFRLFNKYYDTNYDWTDQIKKLEHLNLSLSQVDSKLKQLQVLKSKLFNSNHLFGEVLVPALFEIEDAFLDQSFSQLRQLDIENKILLDKVSNKHPILKSVQNQKEELKEEVLGYIDQLLIAERIKKEELENQKKEKSSIINEIPKVEGQYEHLLREYKSMESSFNHLKQKRSEVGIARSSNVSDNTILDSADRGELIFPNPLKNYSYAFAFGILIPLTVLIIYNYLNDKILDDNYLKNELQLPLLGSIVFEKERHKMRLNNNLNSLTSESFRTLRSALFYLGKQKKCQVILITSSISGEGKSYVGLNLATSFANSGKKTCLVELDLRKPKLKENFTSCFEKGLSHFLLHDESLEVIIQPTSIINLSFVSSGEVFSNPSEILLSSKMDDFFQYLKQNFDTILLDTPPFGIVSETMDLLRFSDINLYIIRKNFTEKKWISQIHKFYFLKDAVKFYFVFNGIKLEKNSYSFDLFQKNQN
jgi:capsular exopolysaccharide synthesis family protein